MLTLVQPARDGQDPPKRRRGIPSPALSLTADEARHLRASIRNIARARYGTLRKLAAELGVHPYILTRKRPPSAGLAVALARVSGMSVDAVLGRTGLAVVQAPPSAPTRGGAA